MSEAAFLYYYLSYSKCIENDENVANSIDDPPTPTPHPTAMTDAFREELSCKDFSHKQKDILKHFL